MMTEDEIKKIVAKMVLQLPLTKKEIALKKLYGVRSNELRWIAQNEGKGGNFI